MRTLHVIGPGRAGGAIAHLLQRRGWPIGSVWARTEITGRNALARIGAGRLAREPCEVLKQEGWVLVGLPDRELAPAAARWAAQLETAAGVVFHLSGALGAEVLAPLRERGRSCGSLHPAFAFADRSPDVESLRGVTFAVEGDPDFRRVAETIVAQLQGQLLSLDAGTKALHHAATAVCSNFLVTVFDLAQQLEAAAGVAPDRSGPALLSLARATLENLGRRGSPQALTGPIERGDAEVVRAHLAAIDQLPGPARETLADLYRRLGRATVEIAWRKGSLDAETRRLLRECLEERP